MQTLEHSAEPPRPVALGRVALIFMVYGALTAISFVIGLAYHRVTFSTGLLGLFIGPGLRRLSTGWRTCALVVLWLTMLSAPIFAYLLLLAPAMVPFDVCGIPLGMVPKEIGILEIAVIFGISVWCYMVLISPAVRRLFGHVEA
jgi:hypothetical protein